MGGCLSGVHVGEVHRVNELAFQSELVEERGVESIGPTWM